MPKNILHSAFSEVGRDAPGLISRNIQIGARRTSFRIDRLTWRSLHEIAQRENITGHELCTAINVVKPTNLSLTVAIRVSVLQYYRDAATDRGHRRAGHGKTVPRRKTIN